MAMVIPQKLQKIYEHLKENYFPVMGDIIFFDLSVDPFVVHRFATWDELDGSEMIGNWINNKKPYAFISYLSTTSGPEVALHGVNFVKVENMITNQITFYREIGPSPDLEQVKREFAVLKSLLGNSKAS